MTHDQATALLHRFQAWRTGRDDRTLDEADLSPRSITEAIDILLAATGTRQKLERENLRLRARLQKAYKSRAESHRRLLAALQ